MFWLEKLHFIDRYFGKNIVFVSEIIAVIEQSVMDMPPKAEICHREADSALRRDSY